MADQTSTEIDERSVIQLTFGRIKELGKQMDAVVIDEDSLPATKQDAVRLLKTHITSLQSRGFSLDMVAAWLKERGLDLGTPTLKSYLSKVSSDGSQKGRRKSKAAKLGRKVKVTSATVVMSKSDTESKKEGVVVKPSAKTNVKNDAFMNARVEKK